MTAQIVTINPCPWCNKTPRLWAQWQTEETWQFYLKCMNPECAVNPKSKHINIRKQQKVNLPHIFSKIEILCRKWNTNNPLDPYENTRIDYEPLEKWITQQLQSCK